MNDNIKNPERTLSKDRYEKQIAFLEEEVSELKSSLCHIQGRQQAEKIKFIKEREQFFKDLSKFLSGLYQETASIQQKILDNLGKLNSVMGEMSSVRVDETMKLLSSDYER